MFHAAMPGEFQHVDVTDKIGPDISMRVFDRIPYPGLRTQMDDPVKLQRPHMGIERIEVGKIEWQKRKPVTAHAGQPVASGLLQRDIVIRIVVVDPDHLIAPRQQGFGQGGTDKSC